MTDELERRPLPLSGPSESGTTDPYREIGKSIGRFTLLNLLGHGGFGIVYLAEQKEPIRRQVALKVIKPGMDSKQVVARFEAERQVLALLDHPNISQVFEAGETEAGGPFFVMEYVRGQSLTEYCDANKLNIDARLQLFIQVCDAVQYAHQKGIIHRDIKPPNILVSVKGEKAIPKIIDFGIAKAISQPLTQRTLFTDWGQLVGTPEYMSPEQAELTNPNIDTRTDIYSLGVLLYELLTGTLPFDPKTLRKAAFDEIMKIIREEEPPHPSTRLSSLGVDAEKAAGNRCTEVRALSKRLHKELEWIPLKAMRKEPDRRYKTASELADDVRNYLKGDPLIAGPESTMYRFRKIMKRHRSLVASCVTILIVLIFGIVVSTIFAIGQAQERQKAEDSRREAQRSAHIAKAVIEFLNKDLLSSIDPAQARGREVTVREILDKASDKIKDQFKDEPLVEASIRNTLAHTYLSLGKYEKAEPHFRRALEINEAFLGSSDPNVAINLSNLAQLLQDTNRLTEAEPLLEQAVETMEKSYGPNHPKVATALNNLATLLQVTNRFNEAEPRLRRALEIDEASLGPNDPNVATDLNNLAELLRVTNRLDEAEPLYRRALVIDEHYFGKDHPDVSRDLNNLAVLLMAMNRLTEAEPMMCRALAIDEQLFGKNHPNVAIRLHNLAHLLKTTNRLAEAQPMMRRALVIDEQTFGKDHPSVASDLSNLAELLQVTNRLDEAERLYRRALAIDEQSFGKDHPEVAFDLNNLAVLLKKTNRFKEAEPLYRRALAINKKSFGEDHPEVARNLSNLGDLLHATNRHTEAEPMLRRALAIDEQSFGKDHPRVAIRLNNLALLLQDTNRLAEAESLMRQALTICEENLVPDHPNTQEIRNNFERLKKKMEEN